MSDQITISKNELANLEATLQQSLQICYRLKKQLVPAASGTNSRKGLSQDQKANLTMKRRGTILKKAS